MIGPSGMKGLKGMDGDMVCNARTVTREEGFSYGLCYSVGNERQHWN